MDYKVMTFKDLAKFGIPYSRSHIKRLQGRQIDPFPQSFTLSKGRGARRFYWEHEVLAWLKRLGSLVKAL